MEAENVLLEKKCGIVISDNNLMAMQYLFYVFSIQSVYWPKEFFVHN